MNINESQHLKWINTTFSDEEKRILSTYYFINQRIQDYGNNIQQRNKHIINLFKSAKDGKKSKAYLWQLMIRNEIIKPNFN